MCLIKMKTIKSSKVLKLTIVLSFMLSLFASNVFADDSKATTKETTKMYFSLNGVNQFMNIDSYVDTYGLIIYNGTYSKDGVKFDIDVNQINNFNKNSNIYDIDYSFYSHLNKITNSENTWNSLEATGSLGSDNDKQIPFSINDILNKNDKIELSMFKNQAVFKKEYHNSNTDNYYKLEIRSGGFTTFTNPIYSKNGSTLVPLRYLSEMLGNEVIFDSKKNEITINDPATKKSILVTLDNKTAFIDGVSTELSIAPERVDGRTYIPISFVSDAFNVTVDYNIIMDGDIRIRKGGEII
jgi:hypothetical protein